MSPRAEIAKLARLLGEDPERFGYLADVPEADLRRVRERATDVLFGADRAVFERIAAASRLVPAALTAAIAQRSFGPTLCARVAAVLEPDRALDLAGRLSTGFLADVAARLDPRRVGAVLTRLPPEMITEVARELAGRGDHIAMGQFVDKLSAEALRVVVATLDEENLLRGAVFSESQDRFPALFAQIADDRLPAVASAMATADDEFAHEILPLLACLDTAGMTRLAAAVGDLPGPPRARLAAVAAATGVLDRLGPLSAALADR
ncbi:hypothetical protein [Actinokineospora iranica]|uniref:Uncharacterized protein n=1 Tax=Actinokineospora iranica TaxID=1271860 RepID=A0A1G6JFA6_9PSEU|nr:hypothetical protein [Actinokineospora iranica]SDC17389.1 hypothetical protein SAMN05216174_101379 [Actinokineospora iranica]